MSLSAEAATAELVRSLYAALAAHEFELARPIDGLAELLDRYDDQFREFRMEPVEVVAAAERALVKVSPFRPLRSPCDAAPRYSVARYGGALRKGIDDTILP